MLLFGHIHKTNFSKDSRILYPGSIIGLSFDSISENHGIICGNITKDSYNIEFITLDSDFYMEECIDISELVDSSELISEIENLYLDRESVYQLKLTGKHRFDLNTDEILKLTNIDNILKIKDETTSNFDYEKISMEKNIRGYFVKELLQKLESCEDEEKKKIQKAIEIGLNLFE